LKNSIIILNSGSDVEGSVDNKISQAFEWINIEV
jgi:hypothetical protein